VTAKPRAVLALLVGAELRHDRAMSHDPRDDTQEDPVAEIVLKVRRSVIHDDLDVRITPSYAPELEQLLKEHDVPISRGAEFSRDPTLAIYALSGSTATITALKAFLRLHRDKKVEVWADHIAITGHSREDEEAILDKYLPMLHPDSDVRPTP
jgi:hypothetical protein